MAYIAADNPRAAIKFGESCVEHARQLTVFPLLGRLYLATPRGEVRELVIAPYRLFYRVAADGSNVRILRVWHAARGDPRLP